MILVPRMLVTTLLKLSLESRSHERFRETRGSLDCHCVHVFWKKHEHAIWLVELWTAILNTMAFVVHQLS